MLLTVDRSGRSPRRSLCYEIIATIADREGVDPTDIEPPAYESLYEVVNPEALDALFAPRENGTPRGSGRITFEYCGYRVEVADDGDVTVDG